MAKKTGASEAVAKKGQKRRSTPAPVKPGKGAKAAGSAVASPSLPTTAALARLVARQSGVDAKIARQVVEAVAKNLAGQIGAATVPSITATQGPVQRVSAAQVGHYRVFGTTLKPKHLTAAQIAKAVESAG